MRLLLDTNAYSGLLRGSEAVAGRVQKAEAILFSSVVAGELLYGFRNGSQYEANREQLEAFLADPFVTLLPVTLTTADRFGLIASALRKSGTPIPVNDMSDSLPKILFFGDPDVFGKVRSDVYEPPR